MPNMPYKVNQVADNHCTVGRRRQSLGDDKVDHIKKIYLRVLVNDGFQFFQLLLEIWLSCLVAKKSQLFLKVRPWHIGLFNDIFYFYLSLLLNSLLELLL